MISPEKYAAARPFPHAVIDGLFPPNLVEAAEMEFPVWEDPRWQKFSNPRELKGITNDQSIMGPATKALVDLMSCGTTLGALSYMSGIPYLIPDLHGGGMHIVPPGGKLGIHTDFNLGAHGYRRLNGLLFLNSNWKEEWGGALELWAQDKSYSVKALPIANRFVVFTSSSKSFHGHPHPLLCPPDRSRKSIAVYYFTKEAPADINDPRDTIFLDV